MDVMGKIAAFEFELIKKLDLTNVSFNDVIVNGLDFMGCKGTVIDLDIIYNCSFRGTILKGGIIFSSNEKPIDFVESDYKSVSAEIRRVLVKKY